MMFSVCYDRECGFVAGSFIGDIELETLKEYTNEAVKTAAEHSCKYFLSDLRRAEVKLSTTDMYYLPRMLRASGFNRSWRSAIVVSKDLEVYSFFETTATNQGYIVKVFMDPNEAVHWLMGEVQAL